MKGVTSVVFAVMLTGCSTVQNWIPSFWDDNQSAKIIDVRQRVQNIDCEQPQQPQAQALVADIQWFKLYSESKGMLQKDVLRLMEPINETAKAWAARPNGSKAYCESKKKILIQQTDRAASGILGRW